MTTPPVSAAESPVHDREGAVPALRKFEVRTVPTAAPPTDSGPRPSTPLELGHKSRGRAVKDVIARIVMWGSFGLAIVPLVWILFTVISKGVGLLLESSWWTNSQRNINSTDVGGGAIHAIQGTLIQAGVTAVIAVPIGVLTAIYLVEYGRGAIARAVSFMVDILTGVPSIVAALFVYAVWVTTFGFQRVGFAVCLALVLLMLPVVVRSTEEMLKLVPNELREASYALGVPKWRTVAKVVLPTALAGIVTGVTLAVARVIGETAPLLIIAGMTDSVNFNLFDGRMATLPVFTYSSVRSPGIPPEFSIDRAWGAALTLLVIVMLLNLIARLVSYYFSPKGER